MHAIPGSQKGSLVNRPTSIDEGRDWMYILPPLWRKYSRYTTEVCLSGRKRPPPLPRWGDRVGGCGKRPFLCSRKVNAMPVSIVAIWIVHAFSASKYC